MPRVVTVESACEPLRRTGEVRLLAPRWGDTQERMGQAMSFATRVHSFIGLIARALDIVRVLGLFLVATVSMWLFETAERLLSRMKKSRQ